jgi:hypothetical protein
MNRKKIRIGLPVGNIDNDPRNLECKIDDMVMRKIMRINFLMGIH